MGIFDRKKPADRCSEFTARVRSQVEAHRREDQKLAAEASALAAKRDRAKGEVLASARAEAEATIASLVSQACDHMRQGAEALAGLGDEPSEPSLDRVREADLDTYLGEQAKFAAALPAHREAVRVISRGTVHALRGLDHEASLVRGEARRIGLEPLGGLGLISEWVLQMRGVRESTVGLGPEPRSWVRHLSDLSTSGTLTAEHLRCAIACLQMPEPDSQAPNATYPGGWRRRESIAPAPTAESWQRVERALESSEGSSEVQS